ncbi:MAG: hypothetical protein HN348_02550 [Proteobacteria bacterium]|nr:hypothetical protein [Pseudomonadota bacterium]
MGFFNRVGNLGKGMSKVWVKSAKEKTNGALDTLRGNEESSDDFDLDDELAAMPKVNHKSAPLPDITPEPTPERPDHDINRPLKRNL